MSKKKKFLLKSKIRSKISKIKKYLVKVLPCIRKWLKSVIKALFMVVLLISSVLGIPEYHKYWLNNKVGLSTVKIKGLGGMGSGFQVKAPSGKAYIVTNNHVCELALLGSSLIIQSELKQVVAVVSYIKRWPDKDLCILPGIDELPALSVGSDPKTGDHVWAAGHPLGEMLTYTEGIVRGKSVIQLATDIPIKECNGPNKHIETVFFFMKACFQDFDALSTTAEIYPGNSGGPLVSYFGSVVGVIFAASQLTHWGEAVPLKHLNEILSEY